MADVPSRLRERVAELRAEGPAPGRAWCRAWSDEVDDALRELHAASAHAPALTVAAVGGYGRRELAPGSDVDLLLLHDGLERPALEVAVRDVVYPLWDAGLTVGYAVRTRRETLAAVEEVDVATSVLDARAVAGSGALVTTTRDEVMRRLHRRPQRFVRGLIVADLARRERAGDAAEVLEPDLKSGAGGLRDVQSLRWVAVALTGEAGLDPLVSAGYLGASDRGRLARAYERLLAERVALHLEADRPSEVLRLDLQDAVAARLGFVDGDGSTDTAAHRLLTAHFLDARVVEHLHRRAWALVAADLRTGRRRSRRPERRVDGFEAVGGTLRVGDGDLERPLGAPLVTRLAAAMTATGAVLDRRTAEYLRRRVTATAEPLAWDDASRRRFLQVLWSGHRALPALHEIDDVGLFVALLPEWSPLRGRPQRNPFHRYSLDRHALHTAAALADLVQREPWATAALERVDDRDALMLAALLHDVGKAHGEPHSETGPPIARAIVDRLGVAAATGDRVERLVAEHLLLVDTATRRDTSDPDLAIALADRLGDAETLAALHLLTAADGLATGPRAWTTWRATLVEQLVRKVQDVFDERAPDELHDGAVATVAEAERLAPELGVDVTAVRAHLARLPARYAAAVPPRAVVRHAAMALEPLGPGEVRTRVTPGVSTDEQRVDELDVVAIDRPGLFAKVAGVVALHGGSILQAHAHTRSDGVAVDTFTVAPPEHASGSWWARVEGDLVEAMGGRLALRARVLQRAARDRARDRHPDVATSITAATDVSGGATVIEVHTRDRRGVLYRIAAALAELDLDIVVAKVSTIGHEVLDVFYVRDASGRPLDDDHVGEVELAIADALDG